MIYCVETKFVYINPFLDWDWDSLTFLEQVFLYYYPYYPYWAEGGTA